MRVPFTLSEDSITTFVGGKMRTVLAGTKSFDALKQHLKQADHDIDMIIKLSDREETVRSATTGGRVSVSHGVVYFDGEEVNNTLTDKLLGLLDEGFDAAPWIKFLENLMMNPSFRSRECLFEFLERFNAPLTPEGKFIAFKRVGPDFKDLHTRTIDNSIGVTVRMDRHMVDDDPQHTCSSGLHVCADEYLQGYANHSEARTLVVEVNPAHVVAVPYDYNFAKMRVCEYTVLNEIEPKDIPEVLEMWLYFDAD